MVRSVARFYPTASHSGGSIEASTCGKLRAALFASTAAQRVSARDRLSGLHSGYAIETQPMPPVGQAEDAAMHGCYCSQPRTPCIQAHHQDLVLYRLARGYPA